MKRVFAILVLAFGFLLISPIEVAADCVSQPPHDPDCESSRPHVCTNIYGDRFCCTEPYECDTCYYFCPIAIPGYVSLGCVTAPHYCSGTTIGSTEDCPSVVGLRCCCGLLATPTPVPTMTGFPTAGPSPPPSQWCIQLPSGPCNPYDPDGYIYECIFQGRLYCCQRSPYMCLSCGQACLEEDPSYVDHRCIRETDCLTRGGFIRGETNYCTDPYACCCLGAPQAPPIPTIPIGLLCSRPDGSTGVSTAIGCVPTTDINAFVGFFLPWGIGIGGGISFLLILLAGFTITTSAGNPDKVKAGKELLTAAVSGLVLIIFSIFILELFGVRIFRLPGF